MVLTVGRRLVPLWILATSVALGCSGGREAVDPDGDSDTDSDSDTDTDTDTDTDVDSLDPWSVMEHNPDCDAFEDYALAGGTSYFWGEYTKQDEEVAGHEAWYIFANPSLVATGQDDCEIHWNMLGEVGDPITCTTCDFSVSVHAAISAADTTCPRGLWEGEEEWDAQYDVRLVGDGTSHFYFASSGDMIGQWYAEGDWFSFLTEPACVWF
ncbi:MAG: hypothetical protein JXX28_10605 [Deltaproteobacteria bacterium]|nr:hypothetical protein [Deltaproteobacteria bacterium]